MDSLSEWLYNSDMANQIPEGMTYDPERCQTCVRCLAALYLYAVIHDESHRQRLLLAIVIPALGAFETHHHRA